MKKRILSTVLISGISVATVTTVNADDLSAKISSQDTIINNLTKEQTAAKNQVTAIKSQITSLQTKRSELESENKRLESESQKLSVDIQKLSSKIVTRNNVLKKQARSAQKNNNTLSYINTIFNSKSISDAINRVVAINKLVSANEKMIAQQESDKSSIETKQSENQKAINTVLANQSELQENESTLATQQANLEVAQLELQAQLASAQGEKDALLAKKAVAEEAARQEAARQAQQLAAARQAQQAGVSSVAAARQAIQNGTAVTNTVTETTPTSVSAASTVSTPVVTTTVAKTSYSNSGNSYPVGQCTWGVKSLAPWVGNNWGNAAQWIASAQAAGHSVGSVPAVGAVAVWPYDGGGYGHVAYVTAVNSSTSIQVMESNYAGNPSIANYRGTFNPTAATWGGGTVYYIYP